MKDMEYLAMSKIIQSVTGLTMTMLDVNTVEELKEILHKIQHIDEFEEFEVPISTEVDKQRFPDLINAFTYANQLFDSIMLHNGWTRK